MKWQEVDVSLSKTESFTSEVACVMPFVNRYLARWIAAKTFFEDTCFNIHVERITLLLKRNPSETDV